MLQQAVRRLLGAPRVIRPRSRPSGGGAAFLLHGVPGPTMRLTAILPPGRLRKNELQAGEQVPPHPPGKFSRRDVSGASRKRPARAAAAALLVFAARGCRRLPQASGAGRRENKSFKAAQGFAGYTRIRSWSRFAHCMADDDRPIPIPLYRVQGALLPAGALGASAPSQTVGRGKELVNQSLPADCGALSKRQVGAQRQVRAGITGGLWGRCAVRLPPVQFAVRFRACQAAMGWARGRVARTRLCASAYQSRTARTFSLPRTRNCRSPRLRAWALTHSAVAARSL